jgi:hypothetical protein
MYEPFIKKYNIVPSKTPDEAGKFKTDDFKVQLLLALLGNTTIENGLYRIHSLQSSIHWSIIIGNYFPDYKGKLVPFGYDWMGRQFTSIKNKKDKLLMFDPATAEVFEINQNILLFHTLELVTNADNILSLELFKEILQKLFLKNLKYSECAGYETPLFLGGIDEVNNYSIYDIEVYWEFTCQIYLQIKDLPPGTKINNIRFEKK